MRVVLRIVPLLALSAASTAIALHSAGIWALTRTERTVSIAVIAGIGFSESCARAVGGVVRERRLRQERWISETLRALLVQVVSASQLDWTDVGVNAFLVRRRRRVGRRVLCRVGRERIRSTPAPSNVIWTRGKGVIGRCWELGRDLGIDLRAHFAAIGNGAEEWDKLGADERLGMTFEEFQRTRQHGLVVATPIVDRTGRVIGVISADSLRGRLESLWNDEVREALGAAALTVRNLLE